MSGQKGVRARALDVHVSTLPVGYSAYSNDKCRCSGCRKAWGDYCAASRRGRAARRDLYPVPHGTYGGYTNYACRCDECRRANADYALDYTARKANA